MRQPFEYRFEWDPFKAAKNFRKHRVSFERAATVFADRRALSRYDPEHSRAEDRWITLGLDRNGVLVVVSHAFLNETAGSATIRIISARRAARSETRQYEDSKR